MLIVADENIPFVREAFGCLGDVRTMPGRSITRDAVRDADMLLVRSVTRVDAALLDGSRVRFVATATIGTDHVDLAALRERGIAFASAPGSNAESVAEYIVAALIEVSGRRGARLAGATIGIVGVGNVGSRVARNAAALGMTVQLSDPPLADAARAGTEIPAHGFTASQLLPLDALLDADYLTLHVPLERRGPHPTRHLACAPLFNRMRTGSVLLNSARGAVADNAALLHAIESGHLGGAVLDVWEGEPAIDASLLQRAEIGTAHIAGYSFDGKVLGTRMIHEAACRHVGVECAWNPSDILPPPEVPRLRMATAGRDAEEIVREAVRAVYDIRRDDGALREILVLPPGDRAVRFDQIRRAYPRRREFNLTAVSLDPPHSAAAAALRALRFRVE